MATVNVPMSDAAQYLAKGISGKLRERLRETIRDALQEFIEKEIENAVESMIGKIKHIDIHNDYMMDRVVVEISISSNDSVTMERMVYPKED